MKIVVSGSTGLIGSALIPVLESQGHEIVRLVRRQPAAGERAVGWNPERGTIDSAGIEGIDVVIHLAGESVVGRWTPAKKQRIRDSRVQGTRLVSDTLAGLTRPPHVLLAASAIGYYGDRGEEELTEQSAAGEDFLAQVAREWEAATAAATRAGIRVVNLRFGVVLDPRGGALGTMLPAFRLGLGGPVGSGDQYLSWTASDDVVHAIIHLLTAPLTGPVNVTAPNPVTNRAFAKVLGHVLGRPVVMAVPGFALRLAFGTEAAAVLLGSQRVLPARLLASGFRFAHESVEPALRHLLAAPPSGR